MSWTLDGKIRIHARLSNTSFMHLHSWASVSLRGLYIGQFLSLHFKNRDEDFLSKGSKDILHDNKILSCTMELPNESASLVVIFVCFVLFSFGTNLWLHVLTKNTRKAFIHMTKINCLVTTLYEVFNKLKAFFFFLFWESTRESKENTFCTLWLPIRAQVFLLARGSHHNI